MNILSVQVSLPRSYSTFYKYFNFAVTATAPPCPLSGEFRFGTLLTVPDSVPDLPPSYDDVMKGCTTPSKQEVTSLLGREVKVLYTFTHTISKDLEITLEEGDKVVIVQQMDDTHFMVFTPGPFKKVKFPISKNVLDI